MEKYKKVRYGDIKVGQWFVYKNHFYIETQDFSGTVTRIPVDLQTGLQNTEISSDDEVFPIVFLNVEYTGGEI